MIIFVNDEKSTYFYLNPKTQTLGSMGNDYRTIRRYAEIPMNLIHVEDYRAIQKFQRILNKGEFKDTPPDELKQTIMNTYPELFL
jgi:hypothetical protein